MTLPVFYTPKMVADAGSFSPSAAKPAQVVRAWLDARLDIAIHAPAPVGVEELALAHDRAWVEEILAGRLENGFGNGSPAVAASLPFTSGAMLAAAREAIARRGIACAPCSGFHHASFARAEGFCTFNGLMVTACVLRRDGARRVGILDCDMHDGNGTDAILARLGASSWVHHFNTGARFHRPEEAAAFLARLPAIAREMRDCDVVLYQAGADPHVDNPLGGWLTTDQLRERDRIVFDTLASLGVPVAWNLAGGYQKEPDGSIPRVLEIHENTARAAIAAQRVARARSEATTRR